MTARLYLRQLPLLQLRIDRLHEDLERRRARLESTTKPLSADIVQTSPGGDRFADAIAALADKDLQYEALLEIYEEFRQRITSQILGMESDLHIKVLLGRYVDGKSLAALADEMYYSRGYIRQVHTLALAAFELKYLHDMVEI